ncbi:MAG TPA: DNA translocase FtsK [candidate division WWE3 bacterium]|uniref:DNA translocase FtsK n=1 Tax=candidate division WWE3 bacterium TaxID=2053526 RepID=A0A7C1DHH3_UNCKA|nr:DNA translocase FtsK [candidate division WWE3 bacterium]
MPKKRGRKKKFKLKLNLDLRPEVIKSVLAVGLTLFGFLTILSFFAPTYSVNAFIQKYIRLGFGLGSLTFPLIVLLLATFFIDALNFRFKNIRVLSGLVLFLFSFSGVLSLFCWKNNPFSRASEGRCGGLLGYYTLYYLNASFGFVGALIIILGIFLIAVILLSNLSLNTVLEAIKAKIAQFKASRASVGEEEPEEVSLEEMTVGDMARKSAGVPLEEEPTSKVEILPPLSEPQNGDSFTPTVFADSTTLTSIAPNLPYADRVWQLPPLSLLDDTKEALPDSGNTQTRKQIIVSTLKSFGIRAEAKDAFPGPAVTQYQIDALSGTKLSKIVNLQHDLAYALASPTGSVRIEAPIPGKSLIGIEVPNNNRVIVPFKSLLTSEPMKALNSKLGIVLGKDVGNLTHVYDIGKMPHLLVAGATGSGKSVFLHSLLFSILFRATPQEVKFIMVDPKRVEFTYYDGIPHLLTPVVTDIEKAPSVFKWAVIEMERRYRLLESARARNIDSYNEKSGFQALPYIVIVVDELGEIMVADPASVEKSIIRLAQLARATGIHLVLSVQRPSTNIITGLIKANIPCRIAFNVSSQVDSRVIIDQPGAEKLLGKGDMLFVPPDASKPIRLQGSWVSETEISTLVKYLKNQGVEPEYKEEILQIVQKAEQSNTSVSSGGDAVDELFDEAVEICVNSGKASASLLQRRLSIGYARAARILDELEAKGVIGPQNGSQPREVLAPKNEGLDSFDDFSF